MFPHNIRSRFGGPDRDEQVRQFIDVFRARPIQYMVLAVEQQYPPEIWDFRRTRYVHYYSTVRVPGRAIAGGAGWRDSIEVIVPGTYMWRTHAQGSGALLVGTKVLEAGQTVHLERGYHRIELAEGGEGILVLSLPEPPAPDTTPFHTT
jgi:hypothetical protein